ncbi:regulatory protein YycH of two-component signal transduction system YycFG [Salsuginibacillus halophilus]|uniref:Regulatory protein YycH of two-component signal transduction system YycFG n=1 Tax=Salsuginibacillus halophilus TaxID=517424 RepID=A0A2P8HI69_9BACI|nr:two-component system activity regulator YycH [Salsuginibacillus halophilus]PSL45914.1 regulatory protein YycH of two-component signal transduction system YycFG [Salsuginibacillus halophilus]
MIIERLKSVLLAGLILLSLWLTWELWTYQPIYSTLDREEYVENEPIGDERDLNDVIYPEKLILNNGATTGMMDGNDLRMHTFFDELRDADFENLSAVSNIDEADVYDLEGDWAELTFPTAIPWEIAEVLFEHDDHASALHLDQVDRILLSDPGGENEELQVRLVSFEEKRMLVGESNFGTSVFEDDYISQVPQLIEAFEVERETDEDNLLPALYLPEETVAHQELSYSTTSLQSDSFMQILFDDPSYVQQHAEQGNTLSYTDGSAMMRLRSGGDELDFNNPGYTEIQGASDMHIVPSTFDFINAHGGWTDAFQLYDWSESRSSPDEVEFRLMAEGLPVFADTGRSMDVIQTAREGSQIVHHARPMFMLDEEEYVEAENVVELENGRDLLTYVDANMPFAREEIDNIRVGYTMEKQDILVSLTPHWYLQSGGRWYPVDMRDRGPEDGLE